MILDISRETLSSHHFLSSNPDDNRHRTARSVWSGRHPRAFDAPGRTKSAGMPRAPDASRGSMPVWRQRRTASLLGKPPQGCLPERPGAAIFLLTERANADTLRVVKHISSFAGHSSALSRGVGCAWLALALVVPVGLCRAGEIPRPMLPAGVGVNIHFVTGQEQDPDLIQQAGFKFMRMVYDWSSIETKKGEYSWKVYDDLLAHLEQRGLRAIFILDYSHPLYEETVTSPHPQSGVAYQKTASPRHPESVAALSRFAAAAAKHFHARHILWEIWNEPNGNFWSPKPNAPEYTALAVATARAIRQAEPKATIIGPAAAAFPWEFLETFLKSGVL